MGVRTGEVLQESDCLVKSPELAPEILKAFKLRFWPPVFVMVRVCDWLVRPTDRLPNDNEVALS